VTPEYLAAVMRSPLVLAQAEYAASGNTHPRVSDDDLGSLLIPVPPRALQRHIASLVRSWGADAVGLRSEAKTLWLQTKEEFQAALFRHK
jgi:type I restriction enzyme, S subunit